MKSLLSEEFLPIADLLAFDADWVSSFYSDICPDGHNYGPWEQTNSELEEYVTELVDAGYLKVLSTRQNGNRKIALTEIGGMEWENRRCPNWNSYSLYLESHGDQEPKRIQVDSIRGSVCWQEIIDQIAFGRIDSDTIISSSFGHEPDLSIAYWKPTENGVFRLVVEHTTKIDSEDTYWESRPDWRSSWRE